MRFNLKDKTKILSWIRGRKENDMFSAGSVKKKVICMLVSILIVFSVLAPLPVFAADGDMITDEEAEELLYKCNNLFQFFYMSRMRDMVLNDIGACDRFINYYIAPWDSLTEIRDKNGNALEYTIGGAYYVWREAPYPILKKTSKIGEGYYTSDRYAVYPGGITLKTEEDIKKIYDSVFVSSLYSELVNSTPATHSAVFNNRRAECKPVVIDQPEELDDYPAFIVNKGLIYYPWANDRKETNDPGSMLYRGEKRRYTLFGADRCYVNVYYREYFDKMLTGVYYGKDDDVREIKNYDRPLFKVGRDSDGTVYADVVFFDYYPVRTDAFMERVVFKKTENGWRIADCRYVDCFFKGYAARYISSAAFVKFLADIGVEEVNPPRETDYFTMVNRFGESWEGDRLYIRGTPPTPAPSENPGGSETVTPDTGDDTQSRAAVFAAGAVLAAAVPALIMTVKRRRKEN